MKVSIKTMKQRNDTEIVEFTLEGEPSKASSQEAEYWAWMRALFSEKVQKTRHPGLAQRILKLW